MGSAHDHRLGGVVRRWPGGALTEEVGMTQPRLTIVPLSLREANDYVVEHHRHHKAAVGHKFSVGVVDEAGTLHGVAIVGRPVARHYDDGLTAEVNRSCTDGTPNANSALYGAAWRVCKAMGYLRLITYTQAGESGSSLRGAGWEVVGERKARGSWAESSIKLRAAKDVVGSGGVERTLWAVPCA